MDSVCQECRHLMVEEMTNGLWFHYCEECMESCGSEEGCWRFERRPECDEP